MVIDNQPKAESKKNNALTNYVDSNVSVVTRTMDTTVPPEVEVVANNIAEIQSVANNITELLSQTKSFNTNYTNLTTANSNNRVPLDTIDTAVSTLTKDVLTSIEKVSQLANDITKVSSLNDTLTNVVAMNSLLTSVNDNIQVISDTGSAIDKVVIVSTMQNHIQQILAIEPQLTAIFDTLGELQTIYNYLPELLAIYAWIKKFNEAKTDLGVTDATIYQVMMDISLNLQKLLELNAISSELLEVKKLLENAPTLLQQIKDDLASIMTTYKAELKDDYEKYVRELKLLVADTKIFISDLLAMLAKYKGQGGTGATVGNLVAGNNILLNSVGDKTEIATLDFIAGENIEITKNDTSITIKANVDNTQIDGGTNIDGVLTDIKDIRVNPNTTNTYLPSNTTSEKEKAFVLAVAGQSNSVGYDESAITQAIVNTMNDRILQLGYNTNNLGYYKLEPCADTMQNMKVSSTTNNLNVTGYMGTKGIHLPLANELLKYLPANYKIIIVPVAFGGTGFGTSFVLGTYDSNTKKASTNARRWGVDTPFYKTLVDRIKFVLSDTTYDSVFGGVVWCLGEFDAMNANNTQTLINSWDSFIERFSNDLNSFANKSINKNINVYSWYNYDSTYYWYKTYRANYSSIMNKMLDSLGRNNFIRFPNDATQTNETNGTGQTSSNRPTHFGNNAFNEIAKLVARKIVTNNSKFFTTTPALDSVDNTLISLTERDIISPNGAVHSFDTKNKLVTNLTPDNSINVLFNNYVYFDKQYKIVLLRPLRKGYIVITSANDMGDIKGVFLANAVKDRTISITNKALTIDSQGVVDNSFTLAPLDSLMLVNNSNSVSIYLLRAEEKEFTDTSYKFMINTEANFTNQLGLAFGVGNADSAYMNSNEITGDIVGISNVAQFGNIETMSNATLTNIFNKYLIKQNRGR